MLSIISFFTLFGMTVLTSGAVCTPLAQAQIIQAAAECITPQAFATVDFLTFHLAVAVRMVGYTFGF